MRSQKDRRFVIVFSVVCYVMAVLMVPVPTKSSDLGLGEYDPWLDWNEDGKIDMKDVGHYMKDAGRVACAFGTSGQNVSKKNISSLVYDSGWIDLRNETGEYYVIAHNLDTIEFQVDAREVTPGFNKTYGGTYSDCAETLVQTADGGYALAGYTTSFGAGQRDFLLVKTDALGNLLWNRTYGGTRDDWAYALIQTGDGGYALAGKTLSYDAGNGDCWLVKTDASGNMQWSKLFGGIELDVARSLRQTSDGGYALAGETRSFGAGSGDFWLLKTDYLGNLMWNMSFGGTNWDSASDLVQTADGGYALVGFTYSFGAGNNDFWLVKTDGLGNMMWNKTFGREGWDEASALVETADGGYALAGYKVSMGSGFADGWLVKTDSVGTMQWNKTYGGTNDDEAYDLVQTSDGGFTLAIWKVSFSGGGGNVWLVKTDASGNIQWNKTYGGEEDDVAYALVKTTDDGYAFAGFTYSYGTGLNDFWLLKTDAVGEIGGVESGLAWTNLSVDTIAVYRGATGWNFIRVRLWKPR